MKSFLHLNMLVQLSIFLLAVLSRSEAGYQGPINHDQPYQQFPSTPNPPGTFSNGAPLLVGFDPESDAIPDPIYAPRDIDLPFHRLFTGTAMFYRTANDPTADSGIWGAQYDSANQTACGIPTNSYWASRLLFIRTS